MVLYAVLFFTFVNTPVLATAPDVRLEDKSIPQIVEHFAKTYKVSSAKMLATMKCESSLVPTMEGDNHTSFGIAQIHLPAHPDVTKEQAFNPVFASEFMAKKFSEGKGHLWTCYRKLYL